MASAAVDAVSTALLSNKSIRLTENCAKAEWRIKGSVVERADLRSRSETEETGVVSGGIHATPGYATGSIAGGRSKEALSSTETIRAVTLSLRLIDGEGEVVFSSTQDSKGSKSRSPIMEAADRAARDLLRELVPSSAKPEPTKPGARPDGYQKLK